jgi:hypothetical protein
MKSWQRHLILGIIIGVISVGLIRTLLTSIPGYDNDSNALVALFVVLAYGIGTVVLGEILLAVERRKN